MHLYEERKSLCCRIVTEKPLWCESIQNLIHLFHKFRYNLNPGTLKATLIPQFLSNGL